MYKNELCLHLLVMNTWMLKLKNAVPITITPKMKYFSIKVTKHDMVMSQSHAGRYVVLMEDVKEGLHEGKSYHVHGQEDSRKEVTSQTDIEV